MVLQTPLDEDGAIWRRFWWFAHGKWGVSHAFRNLSLGVALCGKTPIQPGYEEIYTTPFRCPLCVISAKLLTDQHSGGAETIGVKNKEVA